MLKIERQKLMPEKLKEEKGFAAVEGVVFLLALVVMAVYAIDYYTAIQTGILGSIQARAYLFETLRHRPSADYLRYDRSSDVRFSNANENYERLHMVNDEDYPPDNTNQIPAVGRVITASDESFRNKGQLGAPNQLGFSENNKTSTLFIKSGYGICTDSQCPEDGG